MEDRTRLGTCLHAPLAVLAVALAILASSPRAEAGLGQWTSIGPEGGSVEQIVVAPTTPPTVYVTAQNAGLFKSTDHGDTWVPLLQDPIRALAVDPTAPNTLYALRPDYLLMKSTDGGATWTQMHWFPSTVVAIALDPQTPSTVYVGTYSGVYRSTDGGATWGDVMLSGLIVQALGVLRTTPATVLAETNYGGLYWSTNGGADWNLALLNGGSSLNSYATSFVPHPTTPATVYAAGSDLLRSTDAGATWATVPGVSASGLAIDPTTPTTLYASLGTASAPFGVKSTDGGETWTPMNVSVRFGAMAVDPESPSIVYAATAYHGMFKSADAGDTWAASNSGLIAVYVRELAVDPVVPGRLYAASSNTALQVSADRGSTWRQIDGFYPEVLATAPTSPSTVYAGGCPAGTEGAGQLKRSTDGGDTWIDSDTGIVCLMALAIDPTDPGTLYAATYSHGLMKSINGGQTWANWSPTAPAMTKLAIDPMAPATMYATSYNGVLKSIDGGLTWNPSGFAGEFLIGLAVAPGTPSTVYAGRCGGGVWKSTNGGDTWEYADRSGCVYSLVVGPETPAVVYAAVWGIGVYATHDGGATWDEMIDGLGSFLIEGMAADPTWPSRLYAGTVRSVFEIHTQLAPTKPDLVVTSVGNPPATVSPGGVLALMDTVRNQGAGVADATTTSYYLSLDTTKGASDTALGVRPLLVMAPGDDSLGGTSVTLPSTVTSGTYYLIACADDPPVVSESDETNNCRASTSTVTVQAARGIDLVTTQLSEPPATAAPGGKFSVTDAVTNQGTATAGPSRTRYYLSVDGTKDATDVRLIGVRVVPSLAAGATSSGTVTVTLPSQLPPGTYRLLACADDLMSVKEWDETNNCRASTGTLVLATVDLRITAVSNPPAIASLGTVFIVTDTVINQGSLPARVAVTRYYLSADTIKDASDIRMSGARIVQNLGPGATSTGSVTMVTGLLRVPGRYYLLACADADNNVMESDETNNCLASATTVDVPGADLVVTALADPPVKVWRGAHITVVDTVQNVGTGWAWAPRVHYYLSVDGVKDASDIPLTGVRGVGALLPGTTSTGNIRAIVPSTTPQRVYSLLACVEDIGPVAELDTTNNCRASAGTITIGP